VRKGVECMGGAYRRVGAAAGCGVAFVGGVGGGVLGWHCGGGCVDVDVGCDLMFGGKFCCGRKKVLWTSND